MCHKCVARANADRHAGKAATVVNGDQLTIITECDSCGRREFGPVHVAHLRTLCHMITVAADEMGLPTEHGKLEQVHLDVGDDPDIIRKGLETFETMSLGSSKDSSRSIFGKSVWDKVSH